MGGYVSLNLFRIIPEKFAGLILCDTTQSADSEEKRDSRFSLISKIEKQSSAALVENMLSNVTSEYTKRNLPSVTAELEKIFVKVSPKSAINALLSMAERLDNSDILKQIQVPTLLLFGEYDKVTDLENARKMNQMIAGSELVIIKNAGHLSNLEQSGQFNKALLDFCSRVNFNA
jgi:pimeloyl-ACP methyl ester carboxylesterase